MAKTYIIDDEEFKFSTSDFRELFKNAKKGLSDITGTKCTTEQIKENLSNELHISDETIKKWHSGANSPSDIEMIKAIATFFNTDYKNLLIRKGENTMQCSTTYNSSNEKEVIIEVYNRIIEMISIECFRFNKNIYGSQFQENESLFQKYEEFEFQTFQFIDKNALSISDNTRIKLYNILAELKHSLSGMEDAPGRWLRLNPLYFDAREYFLESGFSIDEEERIRILHIDAERTIEPAYCVEINDCYHECFHKATTKEEAFNTIKGFVKDISIDDIVLQPYDYDRIGPYYSSAEIYRYEFVKLMLAIFREDFPDLFA